MRPPEPTDRSDRPRPAETGRRRRAAGLRRFWPAALLVGLTVATLAQAAEAGSVGGFSRLERYDFTERRDVSLAFGHLSRFEPADGDAVQDYRLAVSDRPLPECLDLSDAWATRREVERSGRTLVVLRIRREEDQERGGSWYATARVFEPELEGFESFPRRALAIEPAGELLTNGRILGRVWTPRRVQVSGPVWSMRLRVDLPLDEVACGRS